MENGSEPYQKSKKGEESTGKMFVPTVVMLALDRVSLAVALLEPKVTIVWIASIITLIRIAGLIASLLGRI